MSSLNNILDQSHMNMFLPLCTADMNNGCVKGELWVSTDRMGETQDPMLQCRRGAYDGVETTTRVKPMTLPRAALIRTNHITVPTTVHFMGGNTQITK